MSDNIPATYATAMDRGRNYAENWQTDPEIRLAFHNELTRLDNVRQPIVKQHELQAASETLRDKGILPQMEISLGSDASTNKFSVVGTEATKAKDGLVVAVVNKETGKAENGSIFILAEDGKFYRAVQNSEKTGYIRDAGDKSGISEKELEQQMAPDRNNVDDPYRFYC
jgi:hypothetical protein